jgi:tetratricopeptide (TPR) repeat protein
MLSKVYLILAFGILMYFAILLGTQIQQTRNINKDLQILKSQKQLKNRSYQTSFQIANLYFQKGMYNEAIEEYSYCLEIWEKDDRLGLAFILNRIVLTYSILKEDDIALYYCKNALRVTPFSTQSLLSLNRLYDSIKLRKSL